MKKYVCVTEHGIEYPVDDLFVGKTITTGNSRYHAVAVTMAAPMPISLGDAVSIVCTNGHTEVFKFNVASIDEPSKGVRHQTLHGINFVSGRKAWFPFRSKVFQIKPASSSWFISSRKIPTPNAAG